MMNVSANSGLTDMNGEVIFDNLPNTNGYIYFYNPNVGGYTRKNFVTGRNDTATKVDMVYQPYVSSVPNQTVLTADFLIGSVCNFCYETIKLGDRFAEVNGRLSHYECFLSHIKGIYQKKIDIALERISSKKLKNDVVYPKEPRAIVDIVDEYLKELEFATQKDYMGSSSTTGMDIWDSIVYRPSARIGFKRTIKFDIVGVLHVGFPAPLCPIIIDVLTGDLHKQIANLRLVKNVEHKIVISEEEFTADGIMVKTIDKFEDYFEKLIKKERYIKGICG
ncbi:MAG: DUF2175 family protein [Candidatus Methylarchaceae archaeon HK01M]|nr:DUF2175 family protein [Candidatus Methylarchaceae archaeon HK01M]